ncbi:hypothetical protein ONS95_007070 [Cadophora gregata]|uniref:uncharacterized protein n=1 Tax=Cadophora gregata TaxID=51156 RepID=UPI0026DD839C|nr:uncharacterized protein ONS95_007070 [Cadophora gregata]KAK0100615.1 hypothetical protein ONS95_007070 [Cadophora gregata]KAK0117386.1 hypothetical protein ONS96_013216 [Cadophora gregata f. sp. sojae]
MIEMGTCLVWSGQQQTARELFSNALNQIESTNPSNWARAAGAHFGLGLVDRHNVDFESSEAHFLEA